MIPMYFPAHTSQLNHLQASIYKNIFLFLFLVYSKCYYSISVRLKLILTVEKQTFFQRRPTPCILSKWPKNSMQFTLGMPFLGVLGKFYRNRKGLRHSSPQHSDITLLNVNYLVEVYIPTGAYLQHICQRPLLEGNCPAECSSNNNNNNNKKTCMEVSVKSEDRD